MEDTPINTNQPKNTNFNSNIPSSGGRTNKAFIFVVIVVLVLALGGLSGYFIGRHEKNKAVEDARQEAAQQAQSDAGQSNDQQSSDHPTKTTTETTCNADELELTLGSGEGAAGTTYYQVILTNTGERTCTLGGYPGVSLVNDNGNMIGNPAERVEGTEQLVTLAPGARTQAAIGVPNSDNFPEGDCQQGATKLRVYPPNDTGYLSVATSVTTWCPGFNVAPVVVVN